MKRSIFLSLFSAFTLGTSCLFAAIPPTAIVEQTFTNKFGTQTSKEEWESRGSTGQVVSVRANGVKITQNFYKGILQGKVTYSFPKSDTVEKTEVYEDGKIVSVISHYSSGAHWQELTPLSTNLIQVSTWYENGVPKSIEEIDGALLVNAVYYRPQHEEESKVEHGFGVRTVRDTKGAFISKDTIQEGVIVLQTTYYPTGEVKSMATYENGVINGTFKRFDLSGQPTEIQEWANNRQHGITTQYLNGELIAQIPYSKGLKDGVERYYKDSQVVQEISWHNGLKNGASRKYTPNGIEVQWFVLGQPISNSKQVAAEMPPIPKAPKQLPAAKKTNSTFPLKFW